MSGALVRLLITTKNAQLFKEMSFDRYCNVNLYLIIKLNYSIISLCWFLSSFCFRSLWSAPVKWKKQAGEQTHTSCFPAPLSGKWLADLWPLCAARITVVVQLSLTEGRCAAIIINWLPSFLHSATAHRFARERFIIVRSVCLGGNGLVLTWTLLTLGLRVLSYLPDLSSRR